jgi:hypothetical protein
MKGVEICGSGERDIKIHASLSEVSQIFSHFALVSNEREVMLPCFLTSVVSAEIKYLVLHAGMILVREKT